VARALYETYFHVRPKGETADVLAAVDAGAPKPVESNRR